MVNYGCDSHQNPVCSEYDNCPERASRLKDLSGEITLTTFMHQAAVVFFWRAATSQPSRFK
jgi:hypothetical protein